MGRLRRRERRLHALRSGYQRPTGALARRRRNQSARPGKRKIAFYAEKPLYKLLGETPPTVPGGSAPTAKSASAAASAMAATAAPSEDVVVNSLDGVGPVDPGRPVSLRSPMLDGSTELLGEVAEPRRGARTPEKSSPLKE